MRLLLALSVGAFLASWLLTRLTRNVALARGLLDVPNARSSHKQPTPRGGGIAIVVVCSLVWVLLFWHEMIAREAFLVLFYGGITVALVGLLDDHFHLSPYLRLAVHICVALWALVWLGAPALRVGQHTLSSGLMSYVLGILGIIWVLNLFNFMDGIDGIAASEAIFVCGSAAAISWLNGFDSSAAVVAMSIAAASLGFLFWNWPPAKIFLGDVGSGYLGYLIAVTTLISTHQNDEALPIWLILGGCFFVDATVTLVQRLLRREKIHLPHRSHAYQHLAHRWSSHRKVTLLIGAINVGWLLPCAWLCSQYADMAIPIVLVAIIPIALLAFLGNAGRDGKPQS